MKFTVANLGRITSAEIDVKPLTVFIGKTNTNKTWTAYSLYGILRSMTFLLRNARATPERITPHSNVDKAIKDVSLRTANVLAAKANEQAEAKAEEKDQTFTLEVTRESILNEALRSGERIDLSLQGDQIAKILAIESPVIKKAVATLAFDWEFFLSAGTVKSLRFVAQGQAITVLGQTPSGGTFQLDSFSRLEEKLTSDFIADQIEVHIRWLAFALFRDAMSFPAERKAVSALLSLLEPSNREPRFTPGVLNVPCADFIRFLTTARQRSPRRLEKPKIVTLLERNIMNGRADFTGPPEQRVFSFKSESGHELQLQASASLVRALAGLDVYLRQFAVQDILVIDEPEMNAHPEAQLKLVELFAMLANEGFTIIITTHSPYFLDHLNNLMEAFKLPDSAKEAIGGELKLKSVEAMISSDRVSAYHFGEDGEVKPLVHDGMIDIESFADETNYLSDLTAKIVDLKEE